MALAEQLTRARSNLGYSKEDVAAALGVNRVLASYWESGTRVPNDRQLAALARLLRVEVRQLLSDEELPDRPDPARMLFRKADKDLPEQGRRGVQDFVDFLDMYGRVAASIGFEIRGLEQSPFALAQGFDRPDDARRKAEEVRAHLRLGLGPIGDIDWVCELLGITVYRTGLGLDLSKTISGAFLRHPEVGFSILVNLEMTPGRRRFTIAHELAHALFHSDREPFVVSYARQDPLERFANLFAGEFLMPTEGIRRAMEEQGIGQRVTDPTEVVHLQRFFRVSYATSLMRLLQARLLPHPLYERFKGIRPVVFARDLGYEVGEEEFEQDLERWRIRRFPPRFLRMLRWAIAADRLSPPTAAGLVGLSLDEIEELITDQPIEDADVQAELDEYVSSGVIGS